MAQAGPYAVRNARSQAKASSRGESQTGLTPGSHSSNKSNEEATILYIKRVLCFKRQGNGSAAGTSAADENRADSLDQLLPPLTSSNEIDVQLYALIAVILDLFVQKWYEKITSDQEFVSQIVQIIAHCTRALEQRFRKADLESLLLDELPDLLLEHVKTVRVAQTSWQGRVDSLECQARYHALRPHVALNPLPIDVESSLAQQENEAAWCVLFVNRMLPLLLPPEDLQNPCLDVLVSEVFSDMVVRGGVCGKGSEPWLLWEGVTKFLHSLRPEHQKSAHAHPTPVGRLDQFGLLSSQLSIQKTENLRGQRRWRFDSVLLTFWSCVQLAMVTWMLLRALGLALMQAPSIPARSRRGCHESITLLDSPSVESGDFDPASSSAGNLLAHGCDRKPMISMQVWACLSHLLCLDRRMPWLAGFLSLLQWTSLYGPGRVCGLNSRLDRLMSSNIHARLLNPVWIPAVLRAARTALFPNNALAQGRLPPTDEEIVRIKADCANAIVEAIPDPLRIRFFATNDQSLMAADVEESLDMLASSYINKHLIVSAMELVTVRLFPELARPES